MNTYTYKINQSMITRFEMNQTPRQALVNMVKDRLRNMYDEYSISVDKETFVHNQIEYEIRVLPTIWSLDPVVWQTEKTRFGEARYLSPFGKWLLRIDNYYAGMSEKALNQIISQIIKKVG